MPFAVKQAVEVEGPPSRNDGERTDMAKAKKAQRASQASKLVTSKMVMSMKPHWHSIQTLPAI